MWKGTAFEDVKVLDLSKACRVCGWLIKFAKYKCEFCDNRYCSSKCYFWHRNLHAIACKRNIGTCTLHFFLRRIEAYEYDLYYLIRVLARWGKKGMRVANMDALEGIDPKRDAMLITSHTTVEKFCRVIEYLRAEIDIIIRSAWNGAIGGPTMYYKPTEFIFANIELLIFLMLKSPKVEIRSNAYRKFIYGFITAAETRAQNYASKMESESTASMMLFNDFTPNMNSGS